MKFVVFNRILDGQSVAVAVNPDQIVWIEPVPPPVQPLSRNPVAPAVVYECEIFMAVGPPIRVPHSFDFVLKTLEDGQS